MKKSAKLIKNNIFGLIIGGIIFSILSVSATTYIYASNQISYGDSDVKTALDKLYDSVTTYSPNARSKYYFKSYNGADYNTNENVILDLTSYSNYKTITKDNILVVVTDVRFSFVGGAWGAQSHNWGYDIKNIGYDQSTGKLILNMPLKQSKSYDYASESIQIDVDIYILDNGMKTANLFNSYTGSTYAANEKVILNLQSYTNYGNLITDSILIVPTNINFNFAGGEWPTNAHSWNYSNMEFIPSFRQNNGNLYLNYPLKISPSLNYGSEVFTMNADIYIF